MKLSVPMNALVGMHLLWLVACSNLKTETGPDQSQFQPDTLSDYSTAHLRFAYTSIDRDSIRAIAEYVEAHCIRIVADLKPGSLSTIRIYLYATLKDMQEAIHWPNAPDWVKGAATGMNEIRMVSPNSRDIAGNTPYTSMLSCIVHEFAHCVTLHVNGTIANRPRWLWESVALYESRQFVDPKGLVYLRNGSQPSLDDLNDINDTRIYDVGYTIMEYVVNTWGVEAIGRLILLNGDLVNGLQLSPEEFQKSWFAYVANKYLQ